MTIYPSILFTVCVACGQAHPAAHRQRGSSGLSLHHVVPRDWRQIISLSVKHPYPWAILPAWCEHCSVSDGSIQIYFPVALYSEERMLDLASLRSYITCGHSSVSVGRETFQDFLQASSPLWKMAQPLKVTIDTSSLILQILPTTYNSWYVQVAPLCSSGDNGKLIYAQHSEK